MSETISIGVDLSNQGGGTAVRELREAADQTSRLSKAEQEYQDRLRQRAGAIMESRRMQADLERRGLGGGTPGGGGIGGASMVAYAKAAAGIALVSHSLNQVARMADVYNNSLQTEFQRRRSLQESLPLVGGFVKSLHDFADAASGVTDKLRRAAIEMQSMQQGIAIAHQLNVGLQGEQSRVIPAEATAGAWGRFGVRDFMAGAPAASSIREYEAFERQLGPRASLEAAQRAKVAQEEARAQFEAQNLPRWEKSAALSGAAGRSVRDLDRLIAGQNAGQDNRKDIEDVKKGAIGSLTEQRGLIDQIIEATNRERDAAIGAANAESSIRKPNIEQQRVKLQLLKEEEGRSRGTTLAFANMTQAERSMAVQYAKQAKDKGFESLLPAQRDFLRRAGAGEFVDIGLEKMGSNDPLTAEFQGLIGQRQLSQIRAEKVKATAEIQVNVQLDEKALAEQIAAITKKYAESVEVALKERNKIDERIRRLQDILKKAGLA